MNKDEAISRLLLIGGKLSPSNNT